MTLQCELRAAGSADVAQAIGATVRDICNLRAEVRLVAPGTLPNDGKVIDDQRKHE